MDKSPSCNRFNEIYNDSLSKYVYGLIENLKGQGFSENTLKNYFRCLRPVQCYMTQEGIDEYTPEVGIEYLDNYYKIHKSKGPSARFKRTCILRLNDFYNGIESIVVHPSRRHKEIPKIFICEAEDFLSSDANRVLSSRTIERKKTALAVFLSKCIDNNINSLTELTPENVISFTINVTDKWQWYIVRDFLRYLATNNQLSKDLSTFVPHLERDFKLPSTYSIEEIHRVEDCIDRSTKIGKRDYAIIVLASCLMMRAGDIIRLCISNIDFEHSTIIFTAQKNSERLKFSMPENVKNALMDYMNSIDISDGVLFRQNQTPYRSLSSSAVYNVVTKYFKAAGIDCMEKHHGPHALRASSATSMVNDDIPYETVRKILGHDSRNAIKHYARVDVEKLRRCSLQPPSVSGNFSIFLEGGDIDV